VCQWVKIWGPVPQQPEIFKTCFWTLTRVNKNYSLFMENCHTPLSINSDLLNFTDSELCCIDSLKRYQAFIHSLHTWSKHAVKKVLIWCSSHKFQAVVTGTVATVLLNVLIRWTRVDTYNDSYSTVSLIDFKVGDVTVMAGLKEIHYKFII
jgi:hypothetical protein